MNFEPDDRFIIHFVILDPVGGIWRSEFRILYDWKKLVKP